MSESKDMFKSGLATMKIGGIVIAISILTSPATLGAGGIAGIVIGSVIAFAGLCMSIGSWFVSDTDDSDCEVRADKKAIDNTHTFVRDNSPVNHCQNVQTNKQPVIVIDNAYGEPKTDDCFAGVFSLFSNPSKDVSSRQNLDARRSVVKF